VLRTRLVESVLSRLGEERLSVLEAAVQHQRGQGWGTATVAAEVAAARQLASPNVELDSAASVLDRVGVVQFEFGGCNIDTRTFLQDFWYLLTGAGYRLHRLGPNGLTPVDRYRETDEVFVTTNYFAAR